MYTCEYGLTKSKLASSVQVEDIDVGFIGKKSKRSKPGEDDNKSKDSNNGVASRKMSNLKDKAQQSDKKEMRSAEKKRKKSDSEEENELPGR